MKNFSSLLCSAVLVLSVGIVQDTRASINPDPHSGGSISVESLVKSANSAVHEAQWKRFSKNLIQALKSGNEGIQQTAMRFVIQYGDNINVAEAALDVMKIYRNDADDNRRRMAVVTLGSMKSDWAISFLERSELFEKSDMVARTIRAVIAG